MVHGPRDWCEAHMHMWSVQKRLGLMIIIKTKSSHFISFVAIADVDITIFGIQHYVTVSQYL